MNTRDVQDLSLGRFDAPAATPATAPQARVRHETREAFISPSRLARFWGVHVNTVYRDLRKGALRAYRLPGGQLRISIAEARRYGRPME
jgi:excisionase family DNA binding protein